MHLSKTWYHPSQTITPSFTLSMVHVNYSLPPKLNTFKLETFCSILLGWKKGINHVFELQNGNKNKINIRIHMYTVLSKLPCINGYSVSLHSHIHTHFYSPVNAHYTHKNNHNCTRTWWLGHIIQCIFLGGSKGLGNEGVITAVLSNTPLSPIVVLIAVKLELAPSHTSTLVLNPYRWKSFTVSRTTPSTYLLSIVLPLV